MSRPVVAATLIAALGAVGSWAAGDVGTATGITFAAADRVLVLAPHPDDEAIACGGVIQHALAAKASVRVVFLTYGDNNQWSFMAYRHHPVLLPSGVRAMGEIRRDEALGADAILGLSATNLTFLGYPDFGTYTIWKAHWAGAGPYRGMLTRATAVPYGNAFRPGAPYKGEEVLADLEAILREYRPTKIFVSHPADHNPDHRALYLFTRVALWDSEAEGAPEVYPYLVHYAGWPEPRGRHPESDLMQPSTLGGGVAWLALTLGDPEIERKGRAVQEHRSQYRYSGAYLDSFVRRNELFGDFPSLLIHGPAGEGDVEIERDRPVSVIPEELTDQEKAVFLGLETRTMTVSNGTVLVRIGYARPLGGAVEVEVNLFGYRPDRPFGQMPKVVLLINESSHRVLDGSAAMEDAGVTVSRRPRELNIAVPLATLGHPDRLLTSARTRFGDVPLDWLAWRVVQIDRGGGDSNPPER
jgi:LmbE family N-acetylglucosaminyl deacetylase